MDEPIACSLEPGEVRAGGDALLPGVFARAERVEEIDSGYRLSFADASQLMTVATVIDRERQCCRFLAFRLTLEPAGGAMTLDVTGPPGAKEFLGSLLTPP